MSDLSLPLWWGEFKIWIWVMSIWFLVNSLDADIRWKLRKWWIIQRHKDYMNILKVGKIFMFTLILKLIWKKSNRADSSSSNKTLKQRTTVELIVVKQNPHVLNLIFLTLFNTILIFISQHLSSWGDITLLFIMCVSGIKEEIITCKIW